ARSHRPRAGPVDALGALVAQDRGHPQRLRRAGGEDRGRVHPPQPSRHRRALPGPAGRADRPARLRRRAARTGTGARRAPRGAAPAGVRRRRRGRPGRAQRDGEHRGHPQPPHGRAAGRHRRRGALRARAVPAVAGRGVGWAAGSRGATGRPRLRRALARPRGARPGRAGRDGRRDPRHVHDDRVRAGGRPRRRGRPGRRALDRHRHHRRRHRPLHRSRPPAGRRRPCGGVLARHVGAAL
ncbi:MAG: hypothetical protein AVDCRST_MAG07-27, partial [uncultured Frankineae bacterium]